MSIAEIVKAVRLCIDEETNNTSAIADVIDEKDDYYMDNIIKAKINSALHWIAITASSSSILSDSKVIGGTTSTMSVEDFDIENNIGVVTLPSDVEIINVSRFRGNGWQKAVVPIEDTDDQALTMYDSTARGAADRPIAAIMREEPIRILMQPKADTATVSYVSVPSSVDTSSDDTDIAISDKLKNAFIYYIAFLLMSAYDDSSKAGQMYTIALQQLGASATNK